MIYVYARHIDSGREDLIGVYNTWADAIERITSLLMDRNTVASKGQYYYFVKER